MPKRNANIHVHPKVFGYIFYNAFLSFTRLPAALMFVYTIIAALIIFLLCSFIDLLRIQLFKLLRVNKLSEFIENKITYLYSKAFNSKT